MVWNKNFQLQEPVQQTWNSISIQVPSALKNLPVGAVQGADITSTWAYENGIISTRAPGFTNDMFIRMRKSELPLRLAASEFFGLIIYLFCCHDLTIRTGNDDKSGIDFGLSVGNFYFRPFSSYSIIIPKAMRKWEVDSKAFTRVEKHSEEKLLL